jgi:hypothetical protein
LSRCQYLSDMRRPRCLPLILLLGLGPAAAAQTTARAPSGILRGVVRDSASGEPVGYALVSAADRDQRTFTSATGRFTLTGIPPGRVLLRVQQVGYRVASIALEVDTRPVGDATEVTVLLARQALVLPELSVEGSQCMGMRDAGASAPEGGSLLGQAFQNAERILALERKYPFILEFHRVVTLLDSSYNRIDGQVDTLRKDSRRYVSYRTGKVLERGLQRERVAAFTSSDIAGEEFQDSHCFWYAGRDSVQGAPGYRIDFAPKPEVRSPDWAGSMLVDSASMALIRTETRLVNLPRSGTDFLSANCTIFYQPIFPSLPQEFQLRCVSSYGGETRHIRVERLLLINHRFIGKAPTEPEPDP